jgi:hypothetical protein
MHMEHAITAIQPESAHAPRQDAGAGPGDNFHGNEDAGLEM